MAGNDPKNRPDDGDSAFPTIDFERAGDVAIGHGAPGMTLRDWFAGQALTGFVSADAHNPEFEDYARRAYAAADAMLAEREKEKPDA